MKRYEFRVVAALVVCLLTMGPCQPRALSGAPQSPATGRRGSEVASPGVRPRQVVISEDQQCTEMRSQYLRSQCRDNGFLTVQRNRVLVQTTGLNTTHVEAEFAVEVCSNKGYSSLRTSSSMTLTKDTREPVIRYRHKKSNKYLCFSRSGRVRVWTKRKADRRGALCMFRQVPVDSGRPYHRLQSVHNRRWHLGFNHKATSLALIKGREPYKGALPRHGKFFDPKRCDFNFYAGEHQKEHREFEFSGLDNLIEKASSAKKQQHSTKAANISDNEPNKQTEFGHKYDTATASDRKISKAHKQALLQQRALKQHKKRYHLKKKIRHWKHKRPRPSRREKKGLRTQSRKQPMSKSQKI